MGIIITISFTIFIYLFTIYQFCIVALSILYLKCVTVRYLLFCVYLKDNKNFQFVQFYLITHSIIKNFVKFMPSWVPSVKS